MQNTLATFRPCVTRNDVSLGTFAVRKMISYKEQDYCAYILTQNKWMMEVASVICCTWQHMNLISFVAVSQHCSCLRAAHTARFSVRNFNHAWKYWSICVSSQTEKITLLSHSHYTRGLLWGRAMFYH